MARLSVNINKVALIRNARGGQIPDLILFAKNCEKFGAEGITVHPRPDERHIRFQDVRELKKTVRTELNIEGNPTANFIDLVMEVRPDQVTLVPDAPEALTSNQGWDTIQNIKFLTETVSTLKRNGIRVSIFIDPIAEMIEGAKETGTDRIELYTEGYAKEYLNNKESAISQYIIAAKRAVQLGMGINAGHDLNLVNLRYFKENIPFLEEVSIGQALISDALYYGIENTIQFYKRELK